MAILRRALLLRLQQTQISNVMSSLSKCSNVPRPTNLSVRLFGGHNIGSISRFSSGDGPVEINLSDAESTRRLHNKLLYRSRQRGFLELDLILGNWVEKNIHSLDEARIRYLVDVLDLENPDLWKWISGQEQPPDAVNSNPVFSAIQSKVLENLNSLLLQLALIQASLGSEDGMISVGFRADQSMVTSDHNMRNYHGSL